MFRYITLLSLLLISLFAVQPTRPSVTYASTISQFAPVGNEWFLDRIGAPVAWHFKADGLNRTTGQPVHVLIIDTGLDSAVASQVLSGTVGLSWSFASTLSVHQDAIGHGTFVATELGGHGNGYYGVCPHCLISMARVFGTADGAYDSDIARAIYWGIAQHVQVISMSLGGPNQDPVLAQAVLAAAKHGILELCAAGNDGDNTDHYPAADPGCYGVGATDFSDAVTSWSDYGDNSVLTAPGNLIAGYLPFGPNVIGGSGFVTISGTSMATPLAAGAAADLLSLGYSPKIVMTALEQGARRPKGYSTLFYGYGVLDLTGALRQLGYEV